MDKNNQACVYILMSESGRFYIGSTDNLERRLHQHALGHTQTTHNMKSFRLILKQTNLKNYPLIL